MKAIRLLAIGCVVFGLGSVAYAQKAKTRAPDTACRGDAARFCGGQVSDRTAACLVNNLDKLQPQCQAKVKQALKNK